MMYTPNFDGKIVGKLVLLYTHMFYATRYKVVQ